MDQVTRAFDVFLGYALASAAVCVGVLSSADMFLRARMTELGWARDVQTVVLVVVTVFALLVLFRVFAPVLKLLLILLLLILGLQLLYPNIARRAEASCGAACVSAG